MKCILGGLLAAAFLAVPAAAATQKKPADIPLEDFFKRAQYSQMVLSPNGSKLAALTPLKGRDNLVVVDLEKRTSTVITNFEKLDAAGIFWVNNTRLCLRVVNGQEVTGEPNYRGLYCIDANGEALENFTEVGGVGGQRGVEPVSPVYDESGDYIMAMRQRSRYSSDLYRFNTHTGRYQILTSDSPGDVVGWVLDRNLVPRIAISTPEREFGQRGKGVPLTTTVWYRAGADAKWEKLWQFRSPWTDDDVYYPVAFDFDNETLYVSTNQGGRDRRAIYAYVSAPLLLLETRPTAWTSWFEAHGCGAQPARGMMFDQFATMIQAAIHGMGVALLPAFLASGEIEAGRLVPAHGQAISGVGAYYLIWPQSGAQHPPLRSFRAWLETETADLQ